MMDDLSGAQMLLGTGGAAVIAALIQFWRPVWSGLAPAEWETRALPIFTWLLAALWQVIVANVLQSTGTAVTFNGWILVFLTSVAALAASGLYSQTKTVARG